MRDNIMHHQMHNLDSPSVITFSTERPRMLVSWSFIAQNAPTESCRCTTRIPWYHQNPAYTHRILFALTACICILVCEKKAPVGQYLAQINVFLKAFNLGGWNLVYRQIVGIFFLHLNMEFMNYILTFIIQDYVFWSSAVISMSSGAV